MTREVKRRRPRGRPKDPDKRAAILKAAKRLFARHGIDRVSMDRLAQSARVSKLTLYSHFQSKEELFQTAVAEKCQEHTPAAVFDTHTPLPLRERLLRIGNGFVELILSDEAMDLHRMMAAQGGRENKLGKLFFAAGPERVLVQLAAVLDATRRDGELDVADSYEAATHFFSLLKGVHHMCALVGARPVPPPAVRRRHVEQVVDLFLRAYRR